MIKVGVINIERWMLSDILPHPKNPRILPERGSKKWEVLKKSVAHDYFDPLVVNRRNSMLVSGHLRREVMIEMGFQSVDVSVVDYDEATHLSRLIAANTLLGEFNEAAMEDFAKALADLGAAPELALMGVDEFSSLLNDVTKKDDDQETVVLMSKAEELSHKWNVMEGDFFEIGSSRLVCGDCTKIESWQRLLGDKKADMLWTDPPYNIDYKGLQDRRNVLRIKKGAESVRESNGIINDNLSREDYQVFLKKVFETAASFIKKGGAAYVAHADLYRLETSLAFRDAGFKEAQCLIWVKKSFTLGRQNYQWQHEPIIYGWLRGAGHYWQGGYRQKTIRDDESDLDSLSRDDLIALVQELRSQRDSTIFREDRSAEGSLHPTVKPIRLVARQIWNSSRRGDTVMEMFAGSGTTIFAAEEIGRSCVATELDPKYCAVILERAEQRGLVVKKL